MATSREFAIAMRKGSASSLVEDGVEFGRSGDAGDAENLLAVRGEGGSERGGLIVGVGSDADAKAMRSVRNGKDGGFESLHTVKDEQVLAVFAAERSGEGEVVVDPERQLPFREVVVNLEREG